MPINHGTLSQQHTAPINAGDNPFMRDLVELDEVLSEDAFTSTDYLKPNLAAKQSTQKEKLKEISHLRQKQSNGLSAMLSDWAHVFHDWVA